MEASGANMAGGCRGCRRRSAHRLLRLVYGAGISGPRGGGGGVA